MSTETASLTRLREAAMRFLLGLLWLQVPLIALVALALGKPLLAPLTTAVASAGLAHVFARSGAPAGRIVVGLGLMACVSTLVGVAAGVKEQVDLHMYYFAMLALLVSLCDWRAVAAAAAAVAVQHTALNFLLPSLIYPGGGDLIRLALHATILVLEAAVLIWLCRKVTGMFEAVEAKTMAAEAAQAEAGRHADEATAAARAAQAAQVARSQDQARVAREDQVVFDALAEALDRLACGDLTYRIEHMLPEKAARLRSDFNGALDSLQTVMRDIAEGAEGIRHGSGQISGAADAMARRAEQQAANLEETAAALAELTANVRRSADGAKTAALAVGRNTEETTRSTGVVVRAIEAMSAIEGSSRQITQIIGVIDEIAFQTNLLALNAGVEAARAGESGKGFAVVAQEVRALAQRSAEAAKEIKVLISDSEQHVAQGVALVGEAGEALDRIAGGVGEIDGLVREMAAASTQQSAGLQQVNGAVSDMDRDTQQNAAMVEESTAASREIAQRAAILADLVGRFRTGSGRPAMSPRLHVVR